MKCPFCPDGRKIDVRLEDVENHLCVFQVGTHFHVHGPTRDKALMKLMIVAAARESGIEVDDQTE
jgi:hypothetical protein